MQCHLANLPKIRQSDRIMKSKVTCGPQPNRGLYRVENAVIIIFIRYVKEKERHITFRHSTWPSSVGSTFTNNLCVLKVADTVPNTHHTALHLTRMFVITCNFYIYV
jgi:hypothetical protein